MDGEWGQTARLIVKVVKKLRIKARGRELRQQNLNPREHEALWGKLLVHLV